ncbi:hypothetical protein NPS70_03575 [Streptomyces sp. C10-9-1]|uniref:hypothetical protein n=1 Tax=Streptomyces sp. C10-9-1 TaxID=1859285 RepID=UPI00211291F8|nr:hypothetical protein [Streptomyces sp. C10-9-1]MCQ6552282.1 hypothetical protein [Streptomyces sp. C10-9-1]
MAGWQQVSALGVAAVLGAQGVAIAAPVPEEANASERQKVSAGSPERQAEGRRPARPGAGPPAGSVTVTLPGSPGAHASVVVSAGHCPPPGRPPGPPEPAPEPPRPTPEPPAPEPPVPSPEPPRPEPVPEPDPVPPAPVPEPAPEPPPPPAAPAPPERPPAPPPAPPPAAAPPPEAVPVAIRRHRPAGQGPEAEGTPLTVLMLVTTTPAVLAAALLRPRAHSAARRGR